MYSSSYRHMLALHQVVYALNQYLLIKKLTKLSSERHLIHDTFFHISYLRSTSWYYCSNLCITKRSYTTYILKLTIDIKTNQVKKEDHTQPKQSNINQLIVSHVSHLLVKQICPNLSRKYFQYWRKEISRSFYQ